MEDLLDQKKRAQDLLLQLKAVIDEQQNTISLQNDRINCLVAEVESLTKTKNKLLDDLQDLNKDNYSEKIVERKSSTSSAKRLSGGCKTKIHQRISSQSSVDGAAKSASVSRSNSFQRKHLEETDAKHHHNSYELSQDLRDKQVEVIRKVYGGARKSEHAARIIQEAYRSFRLRQNFRKICEQNTSRVRRLTIDNVPHIHVARLVDLKAADQPPSSDTAASPTSQMDCTTLSIPATEEQTDNDAAVEVVELVLEPSFAEGDQISEKAVMKCDSIEPTTADAPLVDIVFDQSTAGTEDDGIRSEVSTVNGDTVTEEPDHAAVANYHQSPHDPPTDEELVASVLAVSTPKDVTTLPECMVQQVNCVQRKRKRHGYETVTAPRFGFEASAPNSSTTANDREDKTTALHPNGGVGSRNSSRIIARIRRSGSDVSLTSTENEGDRESLRSLDTMSIASDMSAVGDLSGYHRRSTISVRESWHVEVSNDVLRKRLYRIGLNLFNRKPAKGLRFLIDNMFVQSSPPSVATFLLNRKGLSRQMVGDYIGNTQSVFCQEVLDSVCELMDFSGMELDEALRHFQAQIKVQGEAQKVERLVEAFSQRYCSCNPKLIDGLQNPDSIFILAFAIIMLNTDLHSPNMKHEKRMTSSDFIKNLRGIDNGDDLSETLLQNIYSRIKEKELTTLDDHVTQVLQVENSIVGKKPVLAVPHRRLVCYCRLYQVHDPTKPQKVGLHQREVFLFNDMILITKTLQKKKVGTTYTYKQSLSLYGMSFLVFETSHYPNGIRLIGTMDDKILMTFNAPNEHDRAKFVNDLRESIAEVEQMESIRIEAELEKAHTPVSPSESRRNSLSLSDSKKISSSMQNLNTSVQRAQGRPTSMYNMSMVNLSSNNNNNSSAAGVAANSSISKHFSNSARQHNSRVPVIRSLLNSSANFRRAIRSSTSTTPAAVHHAPSSDATPPLSLAISDV